MVNKPKFNEREMDLLREVSSIGSGNAATALSQMVKKEITINLPDSRMIPVESFPEQFDDPNIIVVGTYMEIFGQISGEMILFFPRKDAITLASILMNKEVKEDDIVSEVHESMYKEVSNIVCSAYINALAKMCDIEILPSVPHYACDMLSAIIDFVLVKLSSKVDKALYINGSFGIEGHNINGNLLVFFEEDSLRKIVDIMMAKLK